MVADIVRPLCWGKQAKSCYACSASKPIAQVQEERTMKSVSAAIIVLSGAILLARAADSGPHDSWIIAGVIGLLLLLTGAITWIVSLGRGPLDKE
jgi:drug/metabolite transporter (DMT)-like permease